MSEYGLSGKERRAAFAFIKHAKEVLTVGGSARAIYLVLLERINWRYKTAYLSRKSMMKEAKISHYTLDKALKLLRDTGHIKAVQYPNGGRGMSPVYKFLKAEMMKHGKSSAKKTSPETSLDTSLETRDPTPQDKKERKKGRASRPEGDKVRVINGRRFTLMAGGEVHAYLARHGWTDRDIENLTTREVNTALAADGYILKD